MAQQSAFTTVTLRRLPQGESLQITISGNMSLNILKDISSGAEIPTISSTNAMVLTPKVYGTNGTQATISNATWTMDGADVPSSVGTYVGNTGVLTITSSPIGKLTDTTVHPIIMVFNAKATLNGHTYDVSKTLVLNCAETSQNSYWGAIEASNGTTLDENTSNTTLTPSLYLGTSKVTSAYTVDWYKTGAGASGADLKLTSDNASAQHVQIIGNQLKVTRDAVDAAAHFEAHFKVGSSEVEAEGVSIVDITDTLQVTAEGDLFANDGGSVVVTVKAYNSKSGQKINIPNASAINVVATDSLRQRNYHADYITKTIESGEGKVSMSESNWRVPFAENQTKGEWAICGDSSAQDTKTTDISLATRCEVNMLIGVTIDM